MKGDKEVILKIPAKCSSSAELLYLHIRFFSYWSVVCKSFEKVFSVELGFYQFMLVLVYDLSRAGF